MEEVEVFRGTGGEAEQGFYEAALAEEGIRCLSKSSGSISQHPVRVGPMAEFSILVSPDDQERARRVIQRLQEPEMLEPEEPLDDSAPEGVLIRHPVTQRDRWIMRVMGLAGLAFAFYLLIPYRDASLWGILLLIPAIGLIASSARS